MRAIIIDDERPSLELLKRIMSKNENLEIVGEFMDGQEALDQMDILAPDVVFADIEMPYLNGIDFAEKIKGKEDTQVVFVTAYDNYALKAFEVNAVNYILKPITEENMNTTVKRLLKHYKPPKNLWERQKKNKILSLGELKIYGEKEGELIKWPTLKTKELFAFFLCEKEKELDKWLLCDILWPDAAPQKAIHNLYSTMNRMKSALKVAGIKTTFQCNKGKYFIDLQNFLWDAEEMMNYLKSNQGITSKNISNFEKVMDLYQGELFESEGYIWAVERSEKIKKHYLEGRKKIAEYYMICKNYYQAKKNFEKIINAEPADEDAVVRLMWLYCLTGNKVQMIYCYKRLEEYLKKELHIEPGKSTKKLYSEFLSKL